MPNWKKLITSGSAAILSNVTASSYTGSFTGSFNGTSSWAVSSSQAVSSSYSLSASYAPSTANGILWNPYNTFVAPNTIGHIAWTYTTATAGKAVVEYWATDNTDYESGKIDLIWDGATSANAFANAGASIGGPPQLAGWTGVYTGGNVELQVNNSSLTDSYAVSMSIMVF